jgi:alpha-glucosidase (family GH31 glycosyl hydrolase)
MRLVSLILLLASSLVASATASSPLFNGPWGPTDPVADSNAVVMYGNVRFTVLTDRLVRMEQQNNSDQHKWEDRKTIAVINRNLPVPDYLIDTTQKGIIKLTTKYLTLEYKIGEAFRADTLSVTGLMNENNSNKKIWTWHYGDDDPYNLLGTIRTLDGLNVVSLNCSQTPYPESDHCEPGLISRSGYAIVNDTSNWALGDDTDWWDGPNRDAEDLYIFGHGHAYKDALADYIKIGGRIPLLPRYAFGVWFSRWYDYTPASAAAVVQEYETHALPLDVFVLDMNWHKKGNWTGYSWDEHLYAPRADAIAYLKSRNLAVSLNLHDAAGVNPWETEYENMCAAVGQDSAKGKQIPFSIVNSTILYALEDVVLKPLEEDGVDFWWIDWQQGEGRKGGGRGGATGGKHNPTIWTAHVRTTDINRRGETNRRGMVLARWGGLGAHRYPVHFSGDAKVCWEQLSFQPYFSMTATNVGALWSHDIAGQYHEPELFTRWLQFSAFSGVLRTHDKGGSAGQCAKNDPETCYLVEPWNVPTKYANANYEALRLRGALLPYVYTSAQQAQSNGLWFITPMYYEWPELEGAYQTAAPHPNESAEFESQYLFGNDMWVAPVVKPANDTDGLARINVWVPPGRWVGLSGGRVIDGAKNGSSSLSLTVDLNEIPAFVRAGAIIPSIPVRSGATIGLAMKQYEELIWTVYLADKAPLVGTGSVYEDDATSTSYLDGASSITYAQYTMARGSTQGATASEETSTAIRFILSSSGLSYDERPSKRATTVRFMNTLPPSKVTFNGSEVSFSRFGGKGFWSYDATNAAVVVEIPPVSVADGFEVFVETTTGAVNSSLDGIGSRLRRINAAKETLDEIRMVPGSQTGQIPSKASLMRAASGSSTLEYLAGHSRSDFDSLVQSYHSLLKAAIAEVEGLSEEKQRDHIMDAEVKRSLLEFVEAHAVPSSADLQNPKAANRISRALELLLDASTQYNLDIRYT